MGKFIDLTGQKRGRLTAIKRMGSGKDGKPLWLCECECGNETIISSYNFGKTLSCGCLKKERIILSRRLPNGDANFNRLFGEYKYNAKKRGLIWDLSIEYAKEITKSVCFYCGNPPSSIKKAIRSNGNYIYNGIDRLDSTKGYTEDNVVPCCGRCNEAKMDIPKDEFLSWVERVYNHSILKKRRQQYENF